ncbi:hypothetical protein [Rhodopseudomonas pseudopalustris]|uniref:Uncharacterized protein n=1 Tax=Rhodopseudomonas pseudopalustris TaxID=1513892 RepID=A0A1H8UGA1_9BRAD|nr:hypothetical protein [Rhodopseudomonas pseudopalustris]SEP01923.1 hypothetical protein SAMN05444123_10723 [Rhodopseudomonas pseudopalustris]
MRNCTPHRGANVVRGVFPAMRSILFLNFIQPNSGRLQIGDADVAQPPRQSKRLVAYLPDPVRVSDVSARFVTPAVYSQFFLF